MYNSLVASLLGRQPKDVSTLPSELDIVFEVKTQPAEKITVMVDMQSDLRHALFSECWGGRMRRELRGKRDSSGREKGREGKKVNGGGRGRDRGKEGEGVNVPFPPVVYPSS